MNKLKCVIYAPIDTFSGYGAHARDKVKAIINLKKDEWDIKVISCKWGDCATGFIQENPEWLFLSDYILQAQLQYQPDYMFWITIPQEAQPIGKYNVLITAGIETTVCTAEWVEGCNRMNEIWVSSNHAKKVFQDTKYEKKDPQGRVIDVIELKKPVKVIFEGADLNKYKILDQTEVNKLNTSINDIKEQFAYLFVGHWIGDGPIGEDRKNISLLIKSFLETFKNKPVKPALILKTSCATNSYMDRNNILDRIFRIKQTVNSQDLPNIYLLHGDFSDVEINELYNHPKVKAMISLTKGEGFGRPLLEFSLVDKPILCSNWSGPVDFLHKDHSVLLNGKLTQIHPSVVNPFLIKEGMWFSVDHMEVGEKLTDIYKNYNRYLIKAKNQGEYSRNNFSFEKMKEVIKLELNQFPDFPKQIELKLPSMFNNSGKKLELPKLERK
jgi:glycosyltransferase involved in cell wall biosynthesis